MPTKRVSNRATNRALHATDEQYKRVSQFNKDLVDEFLMYCETIDRSPETINVYRSNLRIFFVWFTTRCKNKDFVKIKKRDIMNFQNHLVTLGMSANRIRVLRSTISSLSIFIENVLDEEYPEFKNIVNKIPAPTLSPVREKTVLKDEQLEELLDMLVETERYQVACFVALAAFSGARKAELIQYKRSDFTPETLKAGLYCTQEVRGKGRGKAGKKIAKYALKSKVDKYLDLWVAQREEMGVEIDDLFIVKNEDGTFRPAQVSTVNSYMDTCSMLMQLPIYCHSFRHFFVSYLVREGIPLSAVRDLCAHNSTETTEIYNDNSKESSFLKYFEEDGIVEVEEKKLSSL